MQSFLLSWCQDFIKDRSFLLSWYQDSLKDRSFLLSWCQDSLKDRSFLLSWYQDFIKDAIIVVFMVSRFHKGLSQSGFLASSLYKEHRLNALFRYYKHKSMSRTIRKQRSKAIYTSDFYSSTAKANGIINCKAIISPTVALSLLGHVCTETE
jgi:hypothetical protein